MNISRAGRNIAVASAIAVSSGSLCWLFLHHFQLGAADFTWAHHAARAILARGNPFVGTPPGMIPYPLTAAIVALPFAPFPPDIAGALFFGISSGLLALGLIRQDPKRLLIFFAYPYWAALITAQWTPLIMCGAFFPLAFAFSVAKPQTGAPIALTRFSRTGMIAAAVLLIASFILRPQWLFEWIPQARGYLFFVPLLVLPGPLLVLALFRWREQDARLLLLACIMPQRWFYDAFLLWIIPKTPRSIMVTVACSWLTGIWRWYHVPDSAHQVGLWCVLGCYLPMMLVVLLRPLHKEGTQIQNSSRDL